MMHGYLNDLLQICQHRLDEMGPLHSQLFSVIVDDLVAAGVPVHREETTKGWGMHPYLAAVLKPEPGDDYREQVMLEHHSFFSVYGFEWAELEGLTLIGERDVLAQETELNGEDLALLRCIVRDGLRYYDSDEISRLKANRELRRESEREALRGVSLRLPDEFIDLCLKERMPPQAVLKGFIADLCRISLGEYQSGGREAQELAHSYFDRARSSITDSNHH